MKTSTVYPKSIKSVNDFAVLKPGSNNAKLGFKITSNKWKGKRLYSLTLTERETCPTSCHHWDDCYGNNMPFAHRFSTNGLEEKLETEIESLTKKHKEGIVIRLHVLGDFYSKEYVQFWQEMLLQFPTLCLFGYTANWESTPIGREIYLLNIRFHDRCVIRYSKNEQYTSPNRYAGNQLFKGKGFDCPEQTGRLPSCAACGLCWSANRTVRFINH